MLSNTLPIKITFTGGNLLTNTYYYYVVSANYETLYVGKTFCRMINGVNTIEMDIRRILQSKQYNGQWSLQPIYDDDTQEYNPHLGPNYKMTDIDIIQTFTIGIYADDALTDLVDSRDVTVTSAYDLKMEPEVDKLQNVLQWQTSEIPHYPAINTYEYGVFFMFEFDKNNLPDLSNQQYWPRVKKQSGWWYLATNTNSDIVSRTSGTLTLPINVPLTTFFTNMQGNSTITTFDYIYGGTSTTRFSDVVYGGSATTRYNDIVFGGNSRSAGESSQTVTTTFTGDFYAGYLNNYTLSGHIDACPKKYYLAWQTHSGAPFSYGFDGNTVKRLDVTRETLENYHGRKSIVSSTTTKGWTLRSTAISNELQKVMADIIDSPYLYLYDTTTDKGYFCLLNDSSFTFKTARAERRPVSIEFDLTEHISTVK